MLENFKIVKKQLATLNCGWQQKIGEYESYSFFKSGEPETTELNIRVGRRYHSLYCFFNKKDQKVYFIPVELKGNDSRKDIRDRKITWEVKKWEECSFQYYQFYAYRIDKNHCIEYYSKYGWLGINKVYPVSSGYIPCQKGSAVRAVLNNLWDNDEIVYKGVRLEDNNLFFNDWRFDEFIRRKGLKISKKNRDFIESILKNRKPIVEEKCYKFFVNPSECRDTMSAVDMINENLVFRFFNNDGEECGMEIFPHDPKNKSLFITIAGEKYKKEVKKPYGESYNYPNKIYFTESSLKERKIKLLKEKDLFCKFEFMENQNRWASYKALDSLESYLKTSVFESIIKIYYEKYPNTIRRILFNTSNFLCRFEFDEKQNKLYSKFGCNKFEFEYLLDYYEKLFKDQNSNFFEFWNISKIQRRTKNFNSITNDQFIALIQVYSIAEVKSNLGWHLDECVRLIQEATSGVLVSDRDASIPVDLMIKLLGQKIDYTYCDYLRMRFSLSRSHLINKEKYPIFPGVIVEALHNDLVEIQNEQRDKLLNVGFEETVKQCKKYLYENDKYIITCPKDAKELREEGNTLHHCVGGYADRVARGETNIFFLREKENVTQPFYTIEVRNSKVIQIHGMCNKFIGNDPEAVPTVLKWIKMHKFEYNERDVLSTSLTYSGNGTYISMPSEEEIAKA